ncbi:hypothetical protein NDU88_004120 [Pleurodeles waltl]|uniref:Trafficking protein particle complex subunit n=1 Tax=Pleurodeles waltl TaxID=8319 RepID=A0AAV7L0I3_PLEWA|nr:hypothetical protein NDU88_004120 [Pleurodeles waltl]
MAVCIAVIAKENYPLYIRSIPVENELKFHYTVHTSLDVVDEKISAMGKALADQRELYLGLLYPTEDYKVYGYVTNSKVKFVMVVDSSNTALRDNEIRSMFRKLHNSYTDVMCNPFYNPGDPIQSRAFDSMVTSMMVQAVEGGQTPNLKWCLQGPWLYHKKEQEDLEKDTSQELPDAELA